MTFKAKICSSRTFPSNDGRFRQFNPRYYLVFTKEIVLFPKETKKVFANTGGDFITPGGNSLGIQEREKYTLVKLSKYSLDWSPDSKYQVVFERGFIVNIKTDWWNGVKLRIIHRRKFKIDWNSWVAIGTFLLVIGAFIPIFKECNTEKKQSQKTENIVGNKQKPDSLSFQEKKKDTAKKP